MRSPEVVVGDKMDPRRRFEDEGVDIDLDVGIDCRQW